MKKIHIVFSLVALMATGACNNSTDNSNTSGTDSSKVVPAPVDNNNATNPSLADTSYPKKDTMVTKGDSVRSGK